MKGQIIECVEKSCTNSSQNSTLKFYHFPRVGKTNLNRCRLWAEFAFPGQDWSSAEALQKLFTTHKHLCALHFKDDCFLEQNPGALTRYCIPTIRSSSGVSERNLHSTINSVDQLSPASSSEADVDITEPVLKAARSEATGITSRASRKTTEVSAVANAAASVMEVDAPGCEEIDANEVPETSGTPNAQTLRRERNATSCYETDLRLGEDARKKKQEAEEERIQQEKDQETYHQPKTPVPSFPIDVHSSPTKKEDVQIGTSNFSELVTSHSFVDKTLLIQDFVKSGNKATLITCPRKFGKSTNMDMIKTFLEIEVKDNGELIPKQDRKNDKLFANHTLLISKCKEFIQKHLGQYPVISVSFKNVKGSNYRDLFKKVQVAISSTFKQHEYMINVLEHKSKISTTLLEKIEAKDSLQQFLKMYLNNGKDADTAEIESSLKFLSELLYCHFKKKVYVLIDDYDTPLDSIMRSKLENDLSRTNLLIHSMLGAVLKDNDVYLAQGLMTGISVIAKNSSSSELNNVTVYRFLDDHIYGEYYGFHSNEISNLVNEDALDDVTRYYNGYLIINQNLHIYNPWSIMNYVRTGQIKNYWCQSGPIEHIKKLFQNIQIREKFNLLIQENGISFQFNNTPTIEDVQSLQQIFNCAVHVIPESYINLFFSYIFEHGYLTPVKITGQSPLTGMSNYKTPNQEIAQEFARNALSYYVDTYRFKQEYVDSTIAKLQYIIDKFNNFENSEYCYLSSEIEQLRSAIETLCQNLEFTNISTSKDGSHPNESLLHTIIGWIIIQSNAKKFSSEVPINSGMHSGKAVIVASYKELGIIIELKYKKIAAEALKQIQEKGYNNTVVQLPFTKNILDIGINLDENKKVTIQHLYAI